MNRNNIRKLTMCALIIAISYIGFQFLRIDIPVGTERTAFHFGNAFVVIGALLCGPMGGVSGALGLTLADLTSGYITSAPKTFILKLVIGLVTCLIAKVIRKSYESKNLAVNQFKVGLISSICSLGLNVPLDPIFGYFYKTYIIGVPQDMAKTLSKIGSLTTLVNAVISITVVAIVWPAIHKALSKAGLI